MSFSGEIDPRLRWLWCPDCNKSYTVANKEAHAKKHIARPRDGALALREVAELIGKTQGEVNHLVRTGRMDSFHGDEKRPRRWVTKEGLAKYVKEQMEAGDLRIAEMVLKPKRRQNWMPMPEKKPVG